MHCETALVPKMQGGEALPPPTDTRLAYAALTPDLLVSEPHNIPLCPPPTPLLLYPPLGRRFSVWITHTGGGGARPGPAPEEDFSPVVLFAPKPSYL